MPSFTPTAAAIAERRVLAAAELESAIDSVRLVYRNFLAVTGELSGHLPSSERMVLSLDTAICMHLSRAGLGTLLARYPQGQPPALAAVVERQHAKLAGA
jgi:hypothetical protein